MPLPLLLPIASVLSPKIGASTLAESPVLWTSISMGQGSLEIFFNTAPTLSGGPFVNLFAL